MPIYNGPGGVNMAAIYHGSTPIARVYNGADLVWEKAGGDVPGIPPYSNYVLLCGFEGTDGSTSFVDESLSAHTLTATGNAQIDTAQAKFGVSSAYFDGSGDAILVPNSSDWDVGTDSFGIAMFVRHESATGQFHYIGNFNGSSGWRLLRNMGGSLVFSSSQTGNISTSWAPTLNQWYHIAFDREAVSRTCRLYIDGVMVSKITPVSSLPISYPSNSLHIGKYGGGNIQYFNGWMDELLMVRGTVLCGDDAGFTVPASAYPRS